MKVSILTAMRVSPLPRRYFLTTQVIRILFLGLSIAVFCLFGTSLTMMGAACAEAKQPMGSKDIKNLEGRWIRLDGGYILELRDIKKNGSVKAAYFNPRPIKVFRAEVSRKEGRTTVFVELRDVNYPGSTYNLQYDEATDRLKGTYFQAVESLTFNIEFVRVK